jgi:hypothetical protein
MSNSYFRNKMDADDLKALSELKKMQPKSGWTEEKYAELMKPELYESYKSQATKSPYEQGLDADDKKALSGLQQSQRGVRWTAEKYLKSMKPEKYNELKIEADKIKQGQGKYRDLLFFQQLDSQDKMILKKIKVNTPNYTAEEYLKQYYQDDDYNSICETIDSYNSGDLFYKEPEGQEAEEVEYSSNEYDTDEDEGDADVE